MKWRDEEATEGKTVRQEFERDAIWHPRGYSWFELPEISKSDHDCVNPEMKLPRFLSATLFSTILFEFFRARKKRAGFCRLERVDLTPSLRGSQEGHAKLN